MGLFGGSASSSSSLNNALTFNPVITVGDGNDSQSSARQRGTADASATTKDEFGLSAGMAFGGGTATGGTVSRGRDIQPMRRSPAGYGGFYNGGSINPMYAIGALVVAGGGYLLYKKRKRKKK